MQILLANAKIMFGKSDLKPLTTPLFQSIADKLAMEMAAMDTDELARQLDCNLKLASENKLRYLNFFTAEKMPAVMAYTMDIVLSSQNLRSKLSSLYCTT